MKYRITARMRDGNVLIVEFDDEQTAAAEYRMVDRLRRGRWGLPDVSWRTVDGVRWCFAPRDVAGLTLGAVPEEVPVG